MLIHHTQLRAKDAFELSLVIIVKFANVWIHRIDGEAAECLWPFINKRVQC